MGIHHIVSDEQRQHMVLETFEGRAGRDGNVLLRTKAILKGGNECLA
jgi:hypothetical protein